MAANLSGMPIQIVASGGVPVTNMYGVTVQGVQIAAPAFTPTDKGGMVATVVAGGGWPVVLINNDGTEWTP